MATRSALACAGFLLVAALSMPAALAEAAWHAPPPHRAHGHVSVRHAHARHHVAASRHAVRHPRRAAIDHSGGRQYGKVSWYRGGFAGRKSRAGLPRNAAASKTLPLGTRAKVTNLANGKSAEVKITDRGPYVAHRVIDVAPHVANKLGLRAAGVAPVEVKPLDVPQSDGGNKHLRRDP